jgi:hypothetical protein
LEKELPNYQRNQLAGTLACDALIKQILSQSTPLIYEIEKAWEDGKEIGLNQYGNPIGKQNNTSNLKLDI